MRAAAVTPERADQPGLQDAFSEVPSIERPTANHFVNALQLGEREGTRK